eukprot:3444957-Amphidinium_carterae.1
MGMRVPLEVQVVAFMHLCFYMSTSSFHARHVAQNSMRITPPPRKVGFRLGHHGSARVYRLWIVVCVLTSVWAQQKSSTEWSLESTSMVRCSTSGQALKLL